MEEGVRIERTVEHVGGVPITVSAGPGTPRGGVAVLTDGGGAGPHFDDVAARFAALGYVGAVPHLYHRSGVSYVDTGRAEDSEPMRQAFTTEGFLEDLDACFALFAARGVPMERCAVVGFCMGGSIAFYVATQRRFGAAVTFYGAGIARPMYSLPAYMDLAASLRTPWLGLYADLDPALAPEDVEALRPRVAAAQVPTDVVRYAGAHHAFMRPEPAVHHEEAAADAWRRTCAWLEDHMGDRPG